MTQQWTPQDWCDSGREPLLRRLGRIALRPVYCDLFIRHQIQHRIRIEWWTRGIITHTLPKPIRNMIQTKNPTTILPNCIGTSWNTIIPPLQLLFKAERQAFTLWNSAAHITLRDDKGEKYSQYSWIRRLPSSQVHWKLILASREKGWCLQETEGERNPAEAVGDEEGAVIEKDAGAAN